MVELKTDKYTVRIHDGVRFKADNIIIPEDAIQRFARGILAYDPHYFDKKGGDEKSGTKTH